MAWYLVSDIIVLIGTVLMYIVHLAIKIANMWMLRMLILSKVVY